MNQPKHPRRLISLCGVALLVLAGNAAIAQSIPLSPPASVESPDSAEESVFDNIRSAAWDTTDGRYLVHLDDVPTALKSSTVQTWCVRVTDASGKAIRNVKLDFVGGMPQHGHGLPSVPATTAKGGKCPYRIDGIEFHMPGVWQVGFNLTTRSGGKHEIRRFVNVN